MSVINEAIDSEQWANEVTPRFVEVNAVAAEIVVDNAIYDDITAKDGEITSPELRQLGATAVAARHARTLGTLSMLVGEAPYEELFEREALARNAVTEAEAKLTAHHLEQQVLKDRIVAQKEWLVDRLPETDPEATEVTEQLIRSLSDSEEAELNGTLASATQVHKTISALFEAAGTAWPIPKGLLGHGEAQPEYIDSYPVEPKELDCIAKSLQRNRGWVLQNASEKLVTVLTQYPYKSFSAAELRSLIYAPEQPGETVSDSRVTSLVHNATSGKTTIIIELLSDMNMVLQRGERTYIDGNGHPYGQKRAVFRAIRREDEGKYETVRSGSPIDYRGRQVTPHDTSWTTLFGENGDHLAATTEPESTATSTVADGSRDVGQATKNPEATDPRPLVAEIIGQIALDTLAKTGHVTVNNLMPHTSPDTQRRLLDAAVGAHVIVAERARGRWPRLTVAEFVGATLAQIDPSSLSRTRERTKVMRVISEMVAQAVADHQSGA